MRQRQFLWVPPVARDCLPVSLRKAWCAESCLGLRWRCALSRQPNSPAQNTWEKWVACPDSSWWPRNRGETQECVHKRSSGLLWSSGFTRWQETFSKIACCFPLRRVAVALAWRKFISYPCRCKGLSKDAEVEQSFVPVSGTHGWWTVCKDKPHQEPRWEVCLCLCAGGHPCPCVARTATCTAQSCGWSASSVFVLSELTSPQMSDMTWSQNIEGMVLNAKAWLNASLKY